VRRLGLADLPGDSEFTAAGVNLARVKKMYLGLGNRTSPAAGGTGRIFIDDIRVIKSATP